MGEMRNNISFSSDHAVSEIVGALLLIVVAVTAFAAIYMYVFPLPLPSPEPNVELMGYVNDEGIVVLEHMGGETLSNYQIDIKDENGTLIESTTYDNNEDSWGIGECKHLSACTPLSSEEDILEVTVYTSIKNSGLQRVFYGILSGRVIGTFIPSYSEDDMLYSSLRTDTTDEDLICFPYKVNSSLNVTSYIFKWFVNGRSYASILMPFDVNNGTSTKDYSGNGNNGTVHGATWTENGIKGGAYYYDGAGDYIDLGLPDFMQDISRNDYTISIWLNSSDITDDNNLAFEVCDNYPAYKNYIRIFQQDSQIHFAVLETNVLHCVKSYNLSSNQWYHIACVWDATEKYLAIFVNGTKCTESSNRSLSLGAQDGISVGRGSASTPHWYGYIDELQIFEDVVSDEQIYYMYLSQLDPSMIVSLISSQETNLGDIWQCVIIPTDGVTEDTPWETNLLEIVGYGGGG